MTNQNRLLINNCYQITYSLKINRQIYSATFPLPLQYQVYFSQKTTTPYPNTRNSFSCAPSCHKNFFLDKPNRQTFVCLLRALYGACLTSVPQCKSPLPAIALGISMKSISKYPSRRPVFRTKITPFLCPKNAPQECKWLQCVRLVINKRRSPTGDAAAPHRRPRASPSAETPKGAPSAELQATPSRGRRPSAHTFSNKSTAEPSAFTVQNKKHVGTTKSAAGSGAVPADPLGIGCRFSPPRARLYAFALLHNTPAIAFVNAVAY